MFSKTIIATSAIALGASSALAAHVIQVNNNCGEQFVMQVPGHDNVYSQGGGTYTYDGDVNGIIASVGNNCDINGVPCTSAEISLNSGISSADITLIPPHAFNHGLTITMAGQSKTCQSADCPGAFHQDGNDGAYQIQDSNNPNSSITLDFC